MDRYSLCQQIIWKIDSVSEKITQYQKKPHTYGGDTPLYMQQVHTLALIGRNPGINLNTLTELTGRSKVTVSQQITRLCKLGFVDKTRNETNQREVILTLTAKGEDIFSYHEKDDSRFYKLLIDELSIFSEKDLSLIETFVSTLLLALESDEKNGFS